MNILAKESGRFFKKKLRKKFLLLVLVAHPRHAGKLPETPRSKSFWGAFFQKGAFLLGSFL